MAGNGVSLAATLRSETAKVLTTKMWWVLTLSMAGYMAFMAGVLGFSMAAGSDAAGTGLSMSPLETAQSVYTIAPSMGYVFPLVLGALAMTGEVRHRTLTTSYLLQPRRGRVVAAKLLVQAGLGAAVGLVGVLSTIAVGAATLAVAGEPTMLGSGAVWVSAMWGVVALAGWAVIGVGVGTLIPNQVTAIVVILAWTQFVEPIVRVLLGSIDAVSGLSRFLPGAAAEALVGTSFYATAGIGELLPRVAGGLLLLAYAVALAGIGSWTTVRKDVT